MKVHVFGNRPSPAVAAYGLRKTALISSCEFGLEVTDFIMNNFYVDDGLTSVPTEEQAVTLIVDTFRFDKKWIFTPPQDCLEQYECVKCFTL
jgi:hypothetical protein